jgi:hypothetical protein
MYRQPRPQRLLRLTLLAPDNQEAILEGRQAKAKGMQLEELTGRIPGAWEEQSRIVA